MNKLIVEHQHSILKFIDLYQDYITILSDYTPSDTLEDVDFLRNFYRDFEVTLANLEDVVDYFKLKKTFGKEIEETLIHKSLSAKNTHRMQKDTVIKNCMPFITASFLAAQVTHSE